MTHSGEQTWGYTRAPHPEKGCRCLPSQSLGSYSTQMEVMAGQPCVLAKAL